MLILSDSLAFVGPRTPHPVDDPRLWPNVMASIAHVDVETFADFGWTARDVWYAITHSAQLWPVLRRADAVVLAVGSYDTVPNPLPSWLWKRTAMIRSRQVRGVVSRAHRSVVPLLTRLFYYLPGDGPVVLRPRLTTHYLDASCTLLRRARQGVPVLGMTPIVSSARLYAGLHKGRPRAEQAMREWAAAANVPLLDLPAVIGDHMLSGRGNPDGMHLGWEGHKALGEAFAGLVKDLLPPRSAEISPSTLAPAAQDGHSTRRNGAPASPPGMAADYRRD